MDNYWDQRYAKGGISGVGSRGDQRTWRWKLIEEFISNIVEVIDVGCGDLSFWKGKTCKDYIGIDISEVIIKKNRIKRPNWNFIIASSNEYIEGLKKKCVFCLGVLFHIMEEDVFINTLENLCKYSKKYIVIYTWVENPFNRKNSIKRVLKKLLSLDFKNILKNFSYIISPSNTDDIYQYYRPLEKYFYIFKDSSFELIERRITPDNVGAFYFFKKPQTGISKNT